MEAATSCQGQSAFTRAVWTTLPPILFVYANILAFTNLGAWISFMIIFVILFGAFTTIVALNEPGMQLEEADFVFKAAVVAITLLCSFGVVGAILAYLDTDMVLTAADVRIIPLPEISAEHLGYTPEEGVKLLRLGALWTSLANIAFMVTAVGGYLIVTIRRVARQNESGTDYRL